MRQPSEQQQPEDPKCTGSEDGLHCLWETGEVLCMSTDHRMIDCTT